MNRKQLLTFVDNFYEDARKIIEKKNNDYSQEGNPFSNFDLQGTVAGVSTEKTFLMAMGIKIARLRELSENPTNAMVEESLDDTLKDLCNYACLMAGYLESKNE